MTKQTAAAEPADVSAARVLLKTIRDFSQGTPTRTALTAADLRAMEKIREAQTDLRARVASLRGSADAFDAPDLGGITEALNLFLKQQTETHKVFVGVTELPEAGIERGAFRAHLARAGDAIVSQIENYIVGRIAEAARHSQERHDTEAALDQLREVRFAGAAIALYQRLAAAALADDGPEGSACAAAADALFPVLPEILTIPSIATAIPAGVQVWTITDLVMRQVRDAAATKAAALTAQEN